MTEPGPPGETLLGAPLRVPDWPPETRARLEKDLEIAQAVMKVAPYQSDAVMAAPS